MTTDYNFARGDLIYIKIVASEAEFELFGQSLY